MVYKTTISSYKIQEIEIGESWITWQSQYVSGHVIAWSQQYDVTSCKILSSLQRKFDKRSSSLDER